MRVLVKYFLTPSTFFVSMMLFSTIGMSSGFFPEPIYTTDPSGSIDPERLYDQACLVADQYEGYEIPESDMIVITDTLDSEFHTYFYYLQDAIDICYVMRSI